jgi:hypothetical protein
MNDKSELEGGSGNGASIAPLEPGRPDVMPNPPPGGKPEPTKEGEKTSDADDEALVEEDMGDVDVNNSVSEENPPQR